MRVIYEGEKNGIYRNLLQSINDMLPGTSLVTVRLLVHCDFENIHLGSETRCEEMVKSPRFIRLHI